MVLSSDPDASSCPPQPPSVTTPFPLPPLSSVSTAIPLPITLRHHHVTPPPSVSTAYPIPPCQHSAFAPSLNPSVSTQRPKTAAHSTVAPLRQRAVPRPMPSAGFVDRASGRDLGVRGEGDRVDRVVVSVVLVDQRP
eukprot:380250-Rhodomonas_salina.1